MKKEHAYRFAYIHATLYLFNSFYKLIFFYNLIKRFNSSLGQTMPKPKYEMFGPNSFQLFASIYPYFANFSGVFLHGRCRELMAISQRTNHFLSPPHPLVLRLHTLVFELQVLCLFLFRLLLPAFVCVICSNSSMICVALVVVALSLEVDAFVFGERRQYGRFYSSADERWFSGLILI